MNTGQRKIKIRIVCKLLNREIFTTCTTTPIRSFSATHVRVLQTCYRSFQDVNNYINKYFEVKKANSQGKKVHRATFCSNLTCGKHFKISPEQFGVFLVLLFDLPVVGACSVGKWSEEVTCISMKSSHPKQLERDLHL